MAKKRSTGDALAAWRSSEQSVRHLVDEILDSDPSSVKKGDVLAVMKARADADRRMAHYFELCLR